ncbi:MAG: hypothetical protein Q7S39_04835 [Ignavibacteria bacterium]|nr:hypothetical protein [Ignavibacteria bacterium]
MSNWPKGFAGFDNANDFFRDKYKRTSNSPYSWIYSADILKRSADILSVYVKKSFEMFTSGELIDNSEKLPLFFEYNNIGSTYMMLIGFSFENTLKGIITAIKEITANGNLKEDYISHDLNKLVNKINEISKEIILSSEEEDLLKRITQFSIWAGRYPFPTSYLISKPGMFGGKGSLTTIRPTDFGLIDNLYNKFIEILSCKGFRINYKPTNA